MTRNISQMSSSPKAKNINVAFWNKSDSISKPKKVECNAKKIQENKSYY